MPDSERAFPAPPAWDHPPNVPTMHFDPETKRYRWDCTCGLASTRTFDDAPTAVADLRSTHGLV